jgi:hypothetical protein
MAGGLVRSDPSAATICTRPAPATVIVRYQPHDLELKIRNRGGCQATPEPRPGQLER